MLDRGDTDMPASLVTYFDYKSPYAFVANKLIQELSDDCDVVMRAAEI